MAPVSLSLHTNTRSLNLLGNGGNLESSCFLPETEVVGSEEYERIRRESASPKELDEPKDDILLGVPDLFILALLLMLLLPDL